MAQNHRFPGSNGFTWWIGRVTDRADPEQLGRVRVRCLGWHTDDVTALPNDALPWATVVYDPSPSPKIDPPNIADWVFGFFADGSNAAQPYVLGVIPTKGGGGFADDAGDEGPAPLASRPANTAVVTPATSTAPASVVNQPNAPLSGSGTPGAATGTPAPGQAAADAARKTGIPDGQGGTFDEPASSFAPAYPFNKATVSESGHALEMDDSPGAERLNLRHRSGSGVEIQPGGDMSTKVINNAHIFVDGQSFKSVGGGETVSYGTDLKIATGGGAGMLITIDGGGGMIVKVTGGDVLFDVTGNITHTCTGNFTVNASGNVDINGARIDLN